MMGPLCVVLALEECGPLRVSCMPKRNHIAMSIPGQDLRAPLETLAVRLHVAMYGLQPVWPL
jgi:hypothetical protein